MQDIVINPQEILLDDVRYPILGGVRRSVLTPFPPKFVIGDYTRDDEVVNSSWVLSSFNGGLGIQYAQIPRDQDRYWFGDLESRYRHLMLGPRVVQVSDVGPAVLMTEYNGYLYVFTDTDMYRFSNGNLEHLYTLFGGLGRPVAANVFNNDLWLQCELGLLRTDGSFFSEYCANPPSTVDGDPIDLPGLAANVWDDKYFRMTPEGELYYYIIPSLTSGIPTSFYHDWTYAGRLHLPTGSCKQLVVYFDLTGELVLHAITTRGVWAYDFSGRRFYQTALLYPYTVNAGKGAIVWRGELYVPVGSTIYKYNGSTVQNVGPARDDGLPQQLQGDNVLLVDGHGFYFSILQQKSMSDGSVYADTDELRSSSQLIQDVVAEQPATRGAITCSPGTAWHTIYYEQAGALMGAATVATTAEGYRLWFSTSNGLFYTDLSTEMHNPLQNPTAEFKESGFIETAWVDMGWAEIDKLGLYVKVQALGCSATETITIKVAYDEDEDSEPELLGVIARDGLTVLPIGGDDGRLFRSAKLFIEMRRDPAKLKSSPVMRSLNFAFQRRPDPVWGFELNLNLMQDWEGLTAEELRQSLTTFAKKKKSSTFIYHDMSDDRKKEGRVVFSRLLGAEQGGDQQKGRYTLSLIELQEPVSVWTG